MKLPNGTKRIVGALLGVVTTFLLAKGYIDNDTAILIGSISAIIFGVGVGHAVKKSSDKKK